MALIEYRVRPVTRYIVTRYEVQEPVDGARSCGASVSGEFDNYDRAYEIAKALCSDEHRRLGWPVGDERMKYPAFPDPEGPARVSHQQERVDA